jgi:hypothetical protein
VYDRFKIYCLSVILRRVELDIACGGLRGFIQSKT